MILLARQFRLIPVVLIAVTSLLVLKVLALTMEGGYTLGSPRSAQAQNASIPVQTPAAPRLADPDLQGFKGGEAAVRPEAAKRSWAQDVLGFPDHTGSVDAPKPSAPAAEAAAKAQQPEGAVKPITPGTPVQLDTSRPQMSSGERAVLESLNKRRLELEARARELEVRDGLLKAAEKRLEAKIQDVKEQEAKVKTAAGQRGEAEAVQFKSLVTMYENMKAKDAARIFDRLDMRIMVDVVTQMNPRKVSDVLAQMQPEVAEKLTVELANRAGGGREPAGELPKIEGRPGG